jgi:hypothetical protein
MQPVPDAAIAGDDICVGSATDLAISAWVRLSSRTEFCEAFIVGRASGELAGELSNMAHEGLTEEQVRTMKSQGEARLAEKLHIHALTSVAGLRE